MIKLDLNGSKNKALRNRFRYGLSLMIELFIDEKQSIKKPIRKGIIKEIYSSKSGENFFINARVFSTNHDGERIIRHAFISVYYNKEAKRVETAVITPDATFTPVVGSDMLGIVATKEGYMMTYSIGESINNNSPISFAKEATDGQEFAVLTFKFIPEDFKSRLGLELDEKADPICGEEDAYFYLVVDKNGVPQGEIYDSTLNQYLAVRNLNLNAFENEFVDRAFAQRERTGTEAKKITSYLRRLAQ